MKRTPFAPPACAQPEATRSPVDEWTQGLAKRITRRALLGSSLGGLVSVAGGGAWHLPAGAAEATSGAKVVPAADAAARMDKARAWFTDTTLVDQDGQKHSFFSDLLAPRAVLVNAAFVGCSSACPLLTQQLARVRDALGPRFGRDIWFLSLTVDPTHDGPEQLKQFAQRQGVDGVGWRFLTGEHDRVQKVLTRLGLWVDSPEAHQTQLVAGRAAAGRWGKLRPDGSTQALLQQLLRYV